MYPVIKRKMNSDKKWLFSKSDMKRHRISLYGISKFGKLVVSRTQALERFWTKKVQYDSALFKNQNKTWKQI